MTEGTHKEDKDMADCKKAKVAFIIVGSSFGNVFADDVYNRGDYKCFITSNDGEKRHVTTLLIQLGGVPVIDYWLNRASLTKRLRNLEDNVHIIANKDNVDEFEAWANDRFAPTLWCNESTKDDPHLQYQNSLMDVASLVKSRGLDKNTHLCIVDGNCCFGPDFNLTRIVEHSFIRDTDCVTYFKRPDASSYYSHLTKDTDKYLVQVDSNAKSNPEVLAIDSIGSAETAEDSYYMANVYYVHSNSVPALLDFAGSQDEGSVPSARFASSSIANFFKERLDKGYKVYGHECKHCLCLNTLDQFKFADSFFRFYASEVRKA